MRRLLSSIRILFLLLAGLAVSAHAVIPHDHHLTGSACGQKDSCPVPDDKPGQHPCFPVHCHAFNDIAVERLTSVILARYLQNCFLSAICIPCYIDHEFTSSAVPVPEYKRPLPNINIPDFFPLRAPPSVS
jgi:hypothetical protein